MIHVPLWEYWVIVTCIFLLIIYYTYLCVHLVVEGWHYNIKRFGRWNRTISGARDRIADEHGNLVTQKNNKTFFLLGYGFEKIDGYQFHFVEGRESTKVNLATDQAKILWAARKDDALITFERDEWTTHHKDQHDYRFRLNGLETGKRGGVAYRNGPDVVENIKVDALLNSTIIMRNPFKAQYRAGGDADWYNSLYATVTGTFGELMCETVYADLGELRGERLQSALVRNTEPNDASKDTDDDYGSEKEFHFPDSDGNRRDNITFLERINYEMMVVKDLGVELLNVTLMDFEPDGEYKRFVDAMQNQAVSEVEVQTATNKATALGKSLDVKKTFITDVINAQKDASLALKKQVDATVAAKFNSLQNSQVRVYVDGNSQQSPSSSGNDLDLNELVKTAIGLDIAKEINNEKK